jgi:hypothetical protein
MYSSTNRSALQETRAAGLECNILALKLRLISLYSCLSPRNDEPSHIEERIDMKMTWVAATCAGGTLVAALIGALLLGFVRLVAG